MKNKLFITALSLLISATAFGSTINYEGERKETPYGVEVCAMTVTTAAKGLVNVEVFGLGEIVELTIPSTGAYKVVTETAQLPKSTAKISGKMLNGKPLSFTIKINGEKMDCKFL